MDHLVRPRNEKGDLRNRARPAPFGVATIHEDAARCEIVSAGLPSSYSVTLVRGTRSVIRNVQKGVSRDAGTAGFGDFSAIRNAVAAIPATNTIPATSAATMPIALANAR